MPNDTNTPNKPSVPKPSTVGSRPAWFQKAQLMMSILLLVGFGLLAWFMIVEAKSVDNNAWIRMVFIYTGIEAIIFSAVGFLFGNVVQAPRLFAANARADAAEESAEREAEKGKTLASAVKGKASNQVGEILKGITAEQNDGELIALKLVAESLYPEGRQ